MSEKKAGTQKRPDFSNKQTAEAFSRDVGGAVKKKLEGTRGGVMSRETILEHFPYIEKRVGKDNAQGELTAEDLTHWGPL